MDNNKKMKHQNVLVVYNYNRYDFLNYFECSQEQVNFYFAEFTTSQEENNKEYKKYGISLYWGEYNDAFHLLDTIKPDKVLFHYIESNFHILLNAACTHRLIPTYIIDHGVRDININIRLKDYLKPPVRNNTIKSYLILLSQFIPRLKARLYFLRSLALMPEELRLELDRLLKAEQPISNSKLEKPSAYIVISEKTLEYYKYQDKALDDRLNYIIGLPVFDHLAFIEPAADSNKNIIFIDQGLAFRNLYGWTQEKHKAFTQQFSEVCAKDGYKVKVKLHPRQPDRERKNWESLPNIKIVTDKELLELLPSTHIVTGFFSTYHLPLIALSHTTILTLENHPAGKLNVSKSFIDAGVAHPVYGLEDLPWALENIEQLHQQQLPNKKKFEEEWLYKFDGKSGERLRDILLSDSL